MQEVEIQIKLASGKRKHYKFLGPGNWNEMTPMQLLNFARLGMQSHRGKAKLDLIAPMYRIPAKLMEKLSEGHLAAMSRTLEFLYLSNTLTKNRFPILKPSGAKSPRLYGPKDGFKNIRWREFIALDKYYQAYTQSLREDLLEYMIAILYRPKTKEKLSPSERKSDIREKVDLSELGEARKRISGLKTEEKISVLFYYIGCYNELKQLYPNMFPKNPDDSGSDDSEKSGSENPDASEKSGNNEHDWMDFIRMLPNEKFGTIAEIENSFIHDIMFVCNKMMQDKKQNPNDQT